ncbi:MBOAT family protein [Sedimentibacter sp. zth1]|uniref:MBOAT family O-acyltransferase n=1 Tax=Sedimentibacter sp. zth1 TaxID=2816908 RepID=UPI001A92E0B9|nr:MBOAT family protein [Sedimentibacter sp. zth1]QSX06382.1 MBOAT family protein [Sedimentibacter sp. zth1]
MVFSSIFFIYLFFPIAMVLYFANKNMKYKNIILIIISLTFYAWGEPIYVCILIFSSIVDYTIGQIIERNRNNKVSKIAVVCSVVINLSLLGVFKYAGFIVQNINTLFNVNLEFTPLALPIGISFYTFQTISYSVDVYRGNVKPQKSFPNFLLYVSLFPQLIAGPIVRYSEIEKQINYRNTSIDDFNSGINRFILGLGKKVLIANVAGSIATSILDSKISSLTLVSGWTGIIMFTVQIYFDFSGYSDMAIGLGRMFGFTYNENFNYPYISKSITEFWRRWHISLSSFFRDYVYIPLGGNKKHQLFNLIIVWLLTGLWHGAYWNFVLWGIYYGVFLIIEKFFIAKYLDKSSNIIKHIYTLIIVVLGWAIFYYTDLSKLGQFLLVIFGASKNSFIDLSTKILLQNNFIFMVVSFMLCTPILKKLNEIILLKISSKTIYENIYYILLITLNVLIIVLVTAALVQETYNPFLYFRF